MSCDNHMICVASILIVYMIDVEWNGWYSVLIWYWSLSICNDGRSKLIVCVCVCYIGVVSHSAYVSSIWE